MKTKTNIRTIAKLLSTSEDLIYDLAHELVYYINLHILTLSPEKIGEKMRDELDGLAFMTGDNGKTASTLIAESLAWNHFGNSGSTFDKPKVSKLLKGLGFIASATKDADTEASQRSRTVRLAFAKYDPSTPNKDKDKSTKDKPKNKGGRPAMSADSIVEWIKAGNLNSKAEGNKIAVAIAEYFNA